MKYNNILNIPLIELAIGCEVFQLEQVEAMIVAFLHTPIYFDAITSIKILSINFTLFLSCQQHFSFITDDKTYSFWSFVVYLSVVECIPKIKQSLHINIKMYSLTHEPYLVPMEDPLA